MRFLKLEQGDPVTVRLSDVNTITGTIDSITAKGEYVIVNKEGVVTIIGQFLTIEINSDEVTHEPF